MNVRDQNKASIQRNMHYVDNYQDKHIMNSMVFRVFVLLLLLALLSFPIKFMQAEFDDIILKNQNTANELSRNWGNAQTIIGPILSIPYVERSRKIESQVDSNGIRSSVSKDIFNNKTLILLPENMRITAQLDNHVLSRKNVETTVYKGNIDINGNYNLNSLPEPSANTSIDWDKAFIAIGLEDNTSVEPSSPVRWEGSSTMLKPGTKLSHLIKNGYHANIEDVATDAKFPKFRIQLSVKGNQGFSFAPLAELNNATIKSDLPNIKVNSDIPTTSKVQSENNFEANWRISNLVRNSPQEWLLAENDTDSENSTLPVSADFSDVLVGIDIPSKTLEANHMTIKLKSIIPYILPSLGILFLSLLILEFKRNSYSKPKFLHYIVASIPVMLIPLLLFTVKDIIPFEQAYQIIAGASIGLIVLYIMFALKSFFKAFYILLIMGCIYIAIFIKLQYPEYHQFAFAAAAIVITLLLMMVSTTIHEDQ